MSAEVATDEAARKLFLQLKPSCVEVLRSCSAESLGRLDEALRRLPPRIPPPLIEYVLFPLRTWLRRLGGSDRVLLEHLLRSLSLVLSRAAPGQLSLSWDVFQELFAFLSMLLDGQMSHAAGLGVPSEERTLQALRCLKSLFLSATESSVSQLYQNVPAVGHCVSVLLASLGSCEGREVRSTALEGLLALSCLAEEDSTLFTGVGGDIEDTADSLRSLGGRVGRERLRRGEVVASFLPGVTTAVTKLLTSEPNLGQGIVNLGLLVWTRYVSLSLSDVTREESGDVDYVKRAAELVEGVRAEPQTTPTGPAPSNTGRRDLRVQRSRNWMRETDRKLALLAGKMGGVLVTVGGGWRGRRGVVLWAHCLLGNCHRMLVAVAPVLLEVLLTLSHDDYSLVSRPALLSLELFSAQHSSEEGGELVSVLQERLYSLSSSLPRLMRQHDDTRKVSVLQLLAGYLKLLGPHTVTLTLSPPHLSHLTQALVQTLELETTPPHLTELQSLDSVGDHVAGVQNSGPRGSEKEVPQDSVDWWTISLHFKHFRQRRVEELVRDCCHLLGFFGSLRPLLDHLLERNHVAAGDGGGRGSELLVVIGYVLMGAGGRGCVRGRNRPSHAASREELCGVVGEVVDLVTGEGWKRGGGGEEGSTVLHQCLQLQVVAVCVRLLGGEVSGRLERLVYQLLSMRGCPHPQVSLQAFSTLSCLTSTTGARSLSGLISENADYLVNSVCLGLRSHTHSREPLQVLQAVMDHGSEEVLPLMRDSIDELLLSLDLQLAGNKGVWSVLRSLAAALHRWSPETVKKEGVETRGGGCHDDRRGCEDEDFSGYFKSLRRKREEEEVEVDEEGEGETGGAEPVLSPVEQAAVDILERCPHYLPSSSPSSSSLPLTVLDCLHHCLHSLSHTHRTLLPLVHKVWPSLLLRLSDPAHPVALKALELLWDLSEVCGDFIRRRAVKGVWPVIAQSLTGLAEGSRGSAAVYQHSVACKLQMKMLETVAVLSVKLQVSSSDLETLAAACLPYLSHHQPQRLVNSCQSSLTALVNSDPDLLWLLLHQLVPTATTPPPHPSLPTYKFPKLSFSEEFADTVPPLLKMTREYQ